MSNYVVTTDFAAKDNLTSGNPLKKIKGADFTTEFNNIATAVNSKADTASPALTGTPTAPTAPANTNTTQIATTAYVQTELLDLDASNLTSGTVPNARFPATLPAVSGANLTNLNASNLASGTVPDARFPATLPAVSGANLTNLNASNLASGTVPDARFPATLPAVSGANLTNLNASNLASGTVPSARMSGAYTGINQIATSLGQSAIVLSASSTFYRLFGVSTSGVQRWKFGANNDTESGSNTGSNFVLLRYADNDTNLGAVLTVDRQTGRITIAAPDSGAHTFNGNITFGGTLTGNGSGLTNLNASNLASGTVPTARLGSGTANSSTFLRGDGQWSSTLGGAFVASGYVYSEQNSYAGFAWNVPNAPTNQKRALLYAHTSGLVYGLYDDSFGSPQTAFDITRSGTTPLVFTTYCATRTLPASVSFSTTPTFNAQSSNVFYFGAMTSNVTSVTISNPTDGQTIQIRFVQDATGGRTVTLPGSVVVSGSINTAANAVTWLVITYVASASRWEGTWTRIS